MVAPLYDVLPEGGVEEKALLDRFLDDVAELEIELAHNTRSAASHGAVEIFQERREYVVRISIVSLLLAGAPVAVLPAAATQAAPFSIDVVQDPPGDQPVGTPLQWTVTSSTSNPTSHRLIIERPDGARLVFSISGAQTSFIGRPPGKDRSSSKCPFATTLPETWSS